MLCRTMLAIASLLAKGSQAYAPIQMVSGQEKRLVVLPKGFPGNIRGAFTPQKLSLWNLDSNGSPGFIPYFTAKLDQTITWNDVDWCLEATGNKHGEVVLVERCSGAQTQKWNWIPDGRGRSMIQLRDTDLCLDVIDKQGGSNGAPIVLRRCGRQVARWQFVEPLPLPGTSQGDDFSYEARHVMITGLILAGLGAISLGARMRQARATANQDQKTVCAVTALGRVHPSRVAQTHASRTSNISIAHKVPCISTSANKGPSCVMTAAPKALPSLIVFDLDACLWQPEMYELNSGPTEYDAKRGGVKAGWDTVRLFPGAQRVMQRILNDSAFSTVKIGVASSTTEAAYASRCLDVLPADPTGERQEKLSDIVDFRQIYSGNKGRRHFPALHEESGTAYGDMLFFDDCTYGDNCASVASLCEGVTCVRTPDGLTEALFDAGLEAWARGQRGIVQ